MSFSVQKVCNKDINTVKYEQNMQDLNRRHNRIDTIILDRDFEEFLHSSWWPRCKFPWCNDIVVDRHFWDSLAGIDATRSGWLLDSVK